MAKVGKIFKAFFKVIFISCAIVAGALVFAFLGIDFCDVSGIVSSSSVFYATGYTLAFKGPLMNITTFGDNSTTTTEVGQVGMSVGILIAFILLCVAVALALIYLLFAWGKKGAAIKKFFAYGSALCFITCAVLFFCAVPMSKSALSENATAKLLIDSFQLGSGAICSGVFSICAGLFALIAGALGPKGK